MDGFCGNCEAAGALPANWPPSCRSLKVAVHPGFSTHRAFREIGDVGDLIRRALREWEKLLDVEFAILPEYDERRADIFLQLHAFPGSVLADSYLAQNRCDVSLRQRYDTTITWTEGQFFSTVIHEIGHALGLHHDRDRSAIMYYSITGPWKTPNDSDLRQARSLGYEYEPGVPGDPPAPDPPSPPSPPQPEDPMDRIFELLMEILLDMISGCLEDQSRDRVRQRLISRDRIVKRRLNRAVKRAAIELGGREWWRLNRDTLEAQALDEYERMAASDIDALIEEASEEA